MVCYVPIPALSQSTRKATDLVLHKRHYREMALLHLIGRNKELKEMYDKRADPLHVALHHFKPPMREAVRRSVAENNSLNKFRCTKDEAQLSGLTSVDLCKVPCKLNQDLIYYLIPNNINFDDIKHELKEAKRRYNMTLSAATMPSSKRKRTSGSFTNDEPTPQTVDEPRRAPTALKVNLYEKFYPPPPNKRSPEERAFDDTCREIAATPQKYALQLEQMTQQISDMKLTVERLVAEKEEEKAKHKREVEELREEFKRQIRTTGLNRMSIVSTEWHNKYHWMSNYLFGFEKWEYFKHFIHRVFDVNVEITGDEKHIQPFEKICMCAMFVRRAHRRPTFSGIYGRAPSSITNKSSHVKPAGPPKKTSDKHTN